MLFLSPNFCNLAKYMVLLLVEIPSEPVGLMHSIKSVQDIK